MRPVHGKKSNNVFLAHLHLVLDKCSMILSYRRRMVLGMVLFPTIALVFLYTLDASLSGYNQPPGTLKISKCTNFNVYRQEYSVQSPEAGCITILYASDEGYAPVPLNSTLFGTYIPHTDIPSPSPSTRVSESTTKGIQTEEYNLSDPVDRVFRRLANSNDLVWGTDVVKARSRHALAERLYENVNLQQVDIAVVLHLERHPETISMAKDDNLDSLGLHDTLLRPIDGISQDKQNRRYTGVVKMELWFNRTRIQHYASAGYDSLWRIAGVSGRLLALQKEIEGAILLELLDNALPANETRKGTGAVAHNVGSIPKDDSSGSITNLSLISPRQFQGFVDTMFRYFRSFFHNGSVDGLLPDLHAKSSVFDVHISPFTEVTYTHLGPDSATKKNVGFSEIGGITTIVTPVALGYAVCVSCLLYTLILRRTQVPGLYEFFRERGIPYSVVSLAWFLCGFFLLSTSVFILIIVGKAASHLFFTNVDPGLLFLVCTLYCGSMLVFCLMWTLCLQKRTVLATSGLCMMFTVLVASLLISFTGLTTYLYSPTVPWLIPLVLATLPLWHFLRFYDTVLRVVLSKRQSHSVRVAQDQKVPSPPLSNTNMMVSSQASRSDEARCDVKPKTRNNRDKVSLSPQNEVAPRERIYLLDSDKGQLAARKSYRWKEDEGPLLVTPSNITKATIKVNYQPHTSGGFESWYHPSLDYFADLQLLSSQSISSNTSDQGPLTASFQATGLPLTPISVFGSTNPKANVPLNAVPGILSNGRRNDNDSLVGETLMERLKASIVTPIPNPSSSRIAGASHHVQNNYPVSWAQLFHRPEPVVLYVDGQMKFWYAPPPILDVMCMVALIILYGLVIVCIRAPRVRDIESIHPLHLDKLSVGDGDLRGHYKSKMKERERIYSGMYQKKLRLEQENRSPMWIYSLFQKGLGLIYSLYRNKVTYSSLLGGYMWYFPLTSKRDNRNVNIHSAGSEQDGNELSSEESIPGRYCSAMNCNCDACMDRTVFSTCDPFLSLYSADHCGCDETSQMENVTLNMSDTTQYGDGVSNVGKGLQRDLFWQHRLEAPMGNFLDDTSEKCVSDRSSQTYSKLPFSASTLGTMAVVEGIEFVSTSMSHSFASSAKSPRPHMIYGTTALKNGSVVPHLVLNKVPFSSPITNDSSSSSLVMDVAPTLTQRDESSEVLIRTSPNGKDHQSNNEAVTIPIVPGPTALDERIEEDGKYTSNVGTRTQRGGKSPSSGRFRHLSHQILSVSDGMFTTSLRLQQQSSKANSRESTEIVTVPTNSPLEPVADLESTTNIKDLQSNQQGAKLKKKVTFVTDNDPICEASLEEVTSQRGISTQGNSDALSNTSSGVCPPHHNSTSSEHKPVSQTSPMNPRVSKTSLSRNSNSSHSAISSKYHSLSRSMRELSSFGKELNDAVGAEGAPNGSSPQPSLSSQSGSSPPFPCTQNEISFHFKGPGVLGIAGSYISGRSEILQLIAGKVNKYRKKGGENSRYAASKDNVSALEPVLESPFPSQAVDRSTPTTTVPSPRKQKNPVPTAGDTPEISYCGVPSVIRSSSFLGGFMTDKWIPNPEYTKHVHYITPWNSTYHHELSILDSISLRTRALFLQRDAGVSAANSRTDASMNEKVSRKGALVASNMGQTAKTRRSAMRSRRYCNCPTVRLESPDCPNSESTTSYYHAENSDALDASIADAHNVAARQARPSLLERMQNFLGSVLLPRSNGIRRRVVSSVRRHGSDVYTGVSVDEERGEPNMFPLISLKTPFLGQSSEANSTSADELQVGLQTQLPSLSPRSRRELTLPKQYIRDLPQLDSSRIRELTTNFRPDSLNINIKDPNANGLQGECTLRGDANNVLILHGVHLSLHAPRTPRHCVEVLCDFFETFGLSFATITTPYEKLDPAMQCFSRIVVPVLSYLLFALDLPFSMELPQSSYPDGQSHVSKDDPLFKEESSRANKNASAVRAPNPKSMPMQVSMGEGCISKRRKRGDLPQPMDYGNCAHCGGVTHEKNTRQSYTKERSILDSGAAIRPILIIDEIESFFYGGKKSFLKFLVQYISRVVPDSFLILGFQKTASAVQLFREGCIDELRIMEDWREAHRSSRSQPTSLVFPKSENFTQILTTFHPIIDPAYVQQKSDETTSADRNGHRQRQIAPTSASVGATAVNDVESSTMNNGAASLSPDPITFSNSNLVDSRDIEAWHVPSRLRYHWKKERLMAYIFTIHTSVPAWWTSCYGQLLQIRRTDQSLETKSRRSRKSAEVIEISSTSDYLYLLPTPPEHMISMQVRGKQDFILFLLVVLEGLFLDSNQVYLAKELTEKKNFSRPEYWDCPRRQQNSRTNIGNEVGGDMFITSQSFLTQLILMSTCLELHPSSLFTSKRVYYELLKLLVGLLADDAVQRHIMHNCAVPDGKKRNYSEISQDGTCSRSLGTSSPYQTASIEGVVSESGSPITNISTNTSSSSTPSINQPISSPSLRKIEALSTVNMYPRITSFSPTVPTVVKTNLKETHASEGFTLRPLQRESPVPQGFAPRCFVKPKQASRDCHGIHDMEVRKLFKSLYSASLSELNTVPGSVHEIGTTVTFPAYLLPNVLPVIRLLEVLPQLPLVFLEKLCKDKIEQAVMSNNPNSLLYLPIFLFVLHRSKHSIQNFEKLYPALKKNADFARAYRTTSVGRTTIPNGPSISNQDVREGKHEVRSPVIDNLQDKEYKALGKERVSTISLNCVTGESKRQMATRKPLRRNSEGCVEARDVIFQRLKEKGLFAYDQHLLQDARWSAAIVGPYVSLGASKTVNGTICGLQACVCTSLSTKLMTSPRPLSIGRPESTGTAAQGMEKEGGSSVVTSPMPVGAAPRSERIGHSHSTSSNPQGGATTASLSHTKPPLLPFEANTLGTEAISSSVPLRKKIRAQCTEIPYSLSRYAFNTAGVWRVVHMLQYRAMFGITHCVCFVLFSLVLILLLGGSKFSRDVPNCEKGYLLSNDGVCDRSGYIRYIRDATNRTKNRPIYTSTERAPIWEGDPMHKLWRDTERHQNSTLHTSWFIHEDAHSRKRLHLPRTIKEAGNIHYNGEPRLQLAVPEKQHTPLSYPIGPHTTYDPPEALPLYRYQCQDFDETTGFCNQPPEEYEPIPDWTQIRQVKVLAVPLLTELPPVIHYTEAMTSGADVRISDFDRYHASEGEFNRIVQFISARELYGATSSREIDQHVTNAQQYIWYNGREMKGSCKIFGEGTYVSDGKYFGWQRDINNRTEVEDTTYWIVANMPSLGLSLKRSRMNVTFGHASIIAQTETHKEFRPLLDFPQMHYELKIWPLYSAYVSQTDAARRVGYQWSKVFLNNLEPPPLTSRGNGEHVSTVHTERRHEADSVKKRSGNEFMHNKGVAMLTNLWNKKLSAFSGYSETPKQGRIASLGPASSSGCSEFASLSQSSLQEEDAPFVCVSQGLSQMQDDPWYAGPFASPGAAPGFAVVTGLHNLYIRTLFRELNLTHVYPNSSIQTSLVMMPPIEWNQELYWSIPGKFPPVSLVWPIIGLYLLPRIASLLTSLRQQRFTHCYFLSGGTQASFYSGIWLYGLAQQLIVAFPIYLCLLVLNPPSVWKLSFSLACIIVLVGTHLSVGVAILITSCFNNVRISGIAGYVIIISTAVANILTSFGLIEPPRWFYKLPFMSYFQATNVLLAYGDNTMMQSIDIYPSLLLTILYGTIAMFLGILLAFYTIQFQYFHSHGTSHLHPLPEKPYDREKHWKEPSALQFKVGDVVHIESQQSDLQLARHMRFAIGQWTRSPVRADTVGGEVITRPEGVIGSFVDCISKIPLWITATFEMLNGWKSSGQFRWEQDYHVRSVCSTVFRALQRKDSLYPSGWSMGQEKTVEFTGKDLLMHGRLAALLPFDAPVVGMKVQEFLRYFSSIRYRAWKRSARSAFDLDAQLAKVCALAGIAGYTYPKEMTFFSCLWTLLRQSLYSSVSRCRRSKTSLSDKFRKADAKKRIWTSESHSPASNLALRETQTDRVDTNELPRSLCMTILDEEERLTWSSFFDQFFATPVLRAFHKVLVVLSFPENRIYLQEGNRSTMKSISTSRAFDDMAANITQTSSGAIASRGHITDSVEKKKGDPTVDFSPEEQENGLIQADDYLVDLSISERRRVFLALLFAVPTPALLVHEPNWMTTTEDYWFMSRMIDIMAREIASQDIYVSTLRSRDSPPPGNGLRANSHSEHDYSPPSLAGNGLSRLPLSRVLILSTIRTDISLLQTVGSENSILIGKNDSPIDVGDPGKALPPTVASQSLSVTPPISWPRLSKSGIGETPFSCKSNPVVGNDRFSSREVVSDFSFQAAVNRFLLLHNDRLMEMLVCEKRRSTAFMKYTEQEQSLPFDYANSLGPKSILCRDPLAIDNAFCGPVDGMLGVEGDIQPSGRKLNGPVHNQNANERPYISCHSFVITLPVHPPSQHTPFHSVLPLFLDSWEKGSHNNAKNDPSEITYPQCLQYRFQQQGVQLSIGYASLLYLLFSLRVVLHRIPGVQDIDIHELRPVRIAQGAITATVSVVASIRERHDGSSCVMTSKPSTEATTSCDPILNTPLDVLHQMATVQDIEMELLEIIHIFFCICMSEKRIICVSTLDE